MTVKGIKNRPTFVKVMNECMVTRCFLTLHVYCGVKGSDHIQSAHAFGSLKMISSGTQLYGGHDMSRHFMTP